MKKAVALSFASSLLILPLACATSGASEHSTSPDPGLLGRAEQFAGTALSAAKGFLAQTPTQQQPDKQAAAQAGVAAANSQAEQQQGSALSQLEQRALLDWVKSKI